MLSYNFKIPLCVLKGDCSNSSRFITSLRAWYSSHCAFQMHILSDWESLVLDQ